MLRRLSKRRWVPNRRVPGNSDQKDETEPQPLVDCARADVDGVVTLPIQGVADRKEAGQKKEAPSSAEASPGLASRSSLRLCPGDPGGCRGKSLRRAYNGEIARPR
jgi:hypothetical protein